MLRVRSIFFKLMVTYAVILFLSFLVFSVIVYFLLQKDLTKKHQDSWFVQQKTVADYIQNAYQKGWSREILLSSLELSVAKQDKVFYLFDEAGNQLYKIGKSEIAYAPDRQMVLEVLQGAKRAQRIRVGDHWMFVAASPITGTIPMREKAIVMISSGFERDFNRIRDLFQLGLAISIAISSVSIFYLSRKMTEPLREMNRIALQFAKGRFEQRVNVRSMDEIGQLGNSLNYMAQELDSLDQMRKDFVANVSHDLRSPLTSIHGFLGALLDGTIPPERQRRYLLIMKEGTERLMKLVEDLLDLARMEAGQFRIHPVRFNLSEQVRKVMARMEPDFQKHQIQLRLIADEEQDIEVIADPNRIDQVIVNLVQNAIQFSQKGGTVDVILQIEGEKAAVSIRDYGTGISEEEMKHIWERFYKGDKARSKKTGTGIGLSIVKHTLDLHRAPVEVQSETGKGTTFTFSLPLA